MPINSQARSAGPLVEVGLPQKHSISLDTMLINSQAYPAEPLVETDLPTEFPRRCGQQCVSDFPLSSMPSNPQACSAGPRVENRSSSNNHSLSSVTMLMNAQVCSAEPLDKAAWFPELPRR